MGVMHAEPTFGEQGSVVIRREDLDGLVSALREQGYEVVAPTLRESAIVYDKIEDLSALPAGWTDDQQAGTYRLRRRDDAALFAYGPGPQASRRCLFPTEECLFQIEQQNQRFQVTVNGGPKPRVAFLGIRACDLKALALQDKVFLNGSYQDPGYQARRERLFLIAVHCSQPAATCFCASMGTGPNASEGFDLALTEILDGGHRFLVETGSAHGEQILKKLVTRPAEPEDLTAAQKVMDDAAACQQRQLDTTGLRELLYRSAESPHWEEVAARCMACANCTMVCPTCFCNTVDDNSDLGGQKAERWRRWDSCFTLSFSYIHGGSVRTSVAARYRQWLTHKFAAWWDQFGSCGCVGCGRCTTWCPAGIDILEEIRTLRG